ncbi:transcription factor IIIA-like [Ylistrum balloti]|uniref:transcription factor IIIA-like n=1 Tax=Ylistrum balloti TaxID=509963 RepID=UPI002905C9A6|nr:transcription factor IIIA-like [Ylistrum balloti]
MAAKCDVSSTHEYICPFPDCPKTFSRPDRLKIHQRSHTGEKPFKCIVPGCGKSYARSAHLRRHEDNSHELNGETQNQVSCTVDGCGMIFTLVQNLKKHMKRKHEKRQFTCEYNGCGRSFKKNQHLKVHEFEHTNIKPFMCSYEGCGMRFQVPSKLHRHEKVHSGYRCDEAGCSEIFSKWTLLRKHKATQHALERKCPQCYKTFSTKRWLKQHMHVHSSEREMFSCPRDNCGRSYLDQRNLLAHIRSYHDGNRIECPHPDCHRRFTTEQKLAQHQAIHDPNKLPPKKRSRKTKQKNVAALLSGVKEKVSHDLDDITTPPEDRLCENPYDMVDITTRLEDGKNQTSNNKDGITSWLEDGLRKNSNVKTYVGTKEEGCVLDVDSCEGKGVNCVDHAEQDCVEILDNNVGTKTTGPCEDTESIFSVTNISDDCHILENDRHSQSSCDTNLVQFTSDFNCLTSAQKSMTYTSPSVPMKKVCTCFCYKLVDEDLGDLCVECCVSSASPEVQCNS